MVYSSIKFTFLEDLEIGETVAFRVGSFQGDIFSTEEYTWQNVRQQPYQVTQGTPTTIPGERSAISFAQAINLDSNGTGFLQITRNGNEVLVSNSSSNYAFLIALPPYDSSDKVILNIQNNGGFYFAISDIDIIEAEDNPKCSHYGLQIQTSTTVDKITATGLEYIAGNMDNPFTLELPRGVPFTLILEDAQGHSVSQTFLSDDIPGVLNGPNVNVSINASPNGSTVIVTPPSGPQSHEYSLDGQSWQTENSFTGLPAGNYTLYVRDSLGCETTKTFVCSSFGMNSPYISVPKANSFRFANRVDFGDAGNYKNDENTLSCEVDVPLAYTEIQQFQTSDIITTQVRTNYKNITASVNPINSIGNVFVEILPVIKKSNNIGLSDRRDAFRFGLGNGKTGFYFIGGSTYDFDTGQTSGSYSLNGGLPEWAREGNYIKVFVPFGADMWLPIERVYFDSEKNAEVVVVSLVSTIGSISFQVGSIYNKQNYEVYEFTVDLAQYQDETVRASILFSDPNFENVSFLSELINVKINQPNTVEIRYKNKNNAAGILYSTGIEHLIRIPLEVKKAIKVDELENLKTDTSVVLLKASLYEGDSFEFGLVTKEILRKLEQALCHSDVRIDGVGYVKNSSEFEGPLDETNLYVLTADMIKTGGVYDSDSGGFEFADSNSEIPRLISHNGGFIEY